MDQEGLEPNWKNCIFKLVILMLLMTNRVIMHQLINKREKNDRIQFEIIHLKSRTNSKETFDATEELHDLNKNNGTGTSGDSKKRARTIFEMCYRDAISSEQTGSGTRA